MADLLAALAAAIDRARDARGLLAGEAVTVTMPEDEDWTDDQIEYVDPWAGELWAVRS